MYKGALLFDLDGTLVDTAADFIAVVNQMRKEEQLAPLPDDIIRNTVSDGARALIKLAFQLDEHDPAFVLKHQQLLDYYEEQLGFQAALFPGFEALLAHLEKNQIAWGIVTNKPARFTDPLIARLHLSPSNQVAICPDHVTHTKPHAEPLLLAAKKLQLRPEQCVYAGDHARDIESGRNAGMKTISCLYGYIKACDNPKDWQADFSVNNVNELQQLTKQLFNI